MPTKSMSVTPTIIPRNLCFASSLSRKCAIQPHPVSNRHLQAREPIKDAEAHRGKGDELIKGGNLAVYADDDLRLAIIPSRPRVDGESASPSRVTRLIAWSRWRPRCRRCNTGNSRPAIEWTGGGRVDPNADRWARDVNAGAGDVTDRLHARGRDCEPCSPNCLIAVPERRYPTPYSTLPYPATPDRAA
jgi:hypothetical protein